MKRRMLAWALALCMMISLMPAGALAAGPEERAGEETWIEAVGEKKPEGYEDTDDTVTISSPAGLAWLAKQVNGGEDYEGKTVTLTADIELADHQWVPIGTQEYPFSGTFDGGGKTIFYMLVSSNSDGLAGLFGFLRDAEIRDVSLRNAEVTAEKDGIQRTGILAGWIVNTQVEDVVVSGDLNINVSGNAQFSSFGGIVGLADYDTTSLSGNKSALTECEVSDVEVQYQGSANTSSAYLYKTSGGWGTTSYYYLPISIGGLVGAQGNPYSINGHYGCGTTINSCTVTDLQVTRSSRDGSVYEAIGGIIGTARTQVQIQDCEVAGFVADVSATIPGSEVSIGSRGDLRDVLAGIYLGGVAGIFDGDSQMLRCSVIESEASSNVTGGYEDTAGKSGGFYGGLSGMLGFPPGWTDDGLRSEQAHFGGGATIKSCYCEMSFKIQNDESVRYVSSVRSLGDGGKIEVQYVVCNTSGVTVTNANNDFVCGLLEDSGNKKTELIQNQIHPVRALEFEIEETKEPFDYWYRSETMEQASISDLSAWNDHIEDLSRSYTASEEVLSDGNGTERLTFSKAGTHDVTVTITDPKDGDITLVFTLPVTVKESPSYTISASPATLDFGSAQEGYTQPVAQTVTITNDGNQDVTITLPTLTGYTITAGTGGWDTDNKVTFGPGNKVTFTVQPNTGLSVGNHDGTITVETGIGTSAEIKVAFTVTATSTPDPDPDPNPGTGTDDDNDYTLYYHSNFGKDKSFYQSEDDRRMEVRDYSDMSARLPDREGYVFTGWNTEPDGSGDDYVPGDIFRLKRSTDHLYAQWARAEDGVDTGVSRWLDTGDHRAYLSGYPDGAFGPDRSMTRAEVAQMFYGLLLDKDVDVTVSFTDVDGDAWYATAVNTLASLGLVSGVGGGQFAPDRAITRAEFATMAMGFAYLETGGENHFSDVSRSDWFYEYVVSAAGYGWISGYPDGTFRPGNTITRGEVTTIVNNMLARAADEDYVDDHEEDLVRFTDLSGSHWAYYQIMEATNGHDYRTSGGVEQWRGLR